jgi:hypothetical protein
MSAMQCPHLQTDEIYIALQMPPTQWSFLKKSPRPPEVREFNSRTTSQDEAASEAW